MQRSIISSEIFRCSPSTDDDGEDFPEFQEIFSGQGRVTKDGDVEMIDTAAQKPTEYYDVKRLLIQEKGEDDYEYLREYKLNKILAEIAD